VTLLAAVLGLLAGAAFVGCLLFARHYRACEPVPVHCGGRARVGVRLPDGSIDHPCGRHIPARYATTGD
jgi:hypothetical protein